MRMTGWINKPRSRRKWWSSWPYWRPLDIIFPRRQGSTIPTVHIYVGWSRNTTKSTHLISNNDFQKCYTLATIWEKHKLLIISIFKSWKNTMKNISFCKSTFYQLSLFCNKVEKNRLFGKLTIWNSGDYEIPIFLQNVTPNWNKLVKNWKTVKYCKSII